MPLTICLTIAATFLASLYDLRSRRIPNGLTGALAVAAVGVHLFAGPGAALMSLAVMAVLVAGGALLYSRGGIGGGDIKLAVAASGMLGFPLCLSFLLYSALGGGVLAVIYLILRPEARPALARAVSMASGNACVTRGKTVTLPYALAFAFGAAAVALSQSVAPFLRIVS